jgi:O-antigen/teichoic acid export membrane protein
MKFLKELFYRFFRSRLVLGSFIMSVGTVIGGAGNYLYHLLMGRMLGPADYGILVSLISLFYLLSIPMGTLGLVIVKFVSAFKGKKDMVSISALFRIGTKKILPFSFLVLLIFLALTPFVTSFLHLSSILPYILVLVVFFVGIFSTINRAVLQGLFRFGFLTLSGVVEVGLKLVTALLLVTLGFKVNGALGGILMGGVVGLLFTFFPLRFLWSQKQKRELKTKEMFNFALPVFFSTLAFTSLYTTDVILVRHFLPGATSGLYAALSTLGKIIFFISGPIIAVMFPLVSERHANGGNYRHLLWASLSLVALVCFLFTSVYFLFPSFMINVLYGKQYLPVVPYLGLFGIFLSFYSLSFLLTNFFLSIGKTKTVIFPLIAGLLQIIFICLFHQNLWQVIFISISLLTLLFLGLLLYWFQYVRQKRQLWLTK